ncbi:platelet-derived growth factor subunit A-like [Neocloeon triangulifer]|uniref:platelet-derived growth factor subunit A-like n=1 Tax=Neocloeon triangulifer TaxID=2078957 RepID=UPI00286F036F|nr:platelet-derived growth factor subunit A-like [Neocloeon triangulifer]
MRNCIAILVLAWAVCVWATDDPIVFPAGSSSSVRRQPNRRPGFKAAPCVSCNKSKRQSVQATTSKPQLEEEDQGVPLDLIKKMNDIENEFEFLALIGSTNREMVNVSGLYDVDPGSLQFRISRAHNEGQTSDEIDVDSPVAHSIGKSSVERAKQAKCMPENTTVLLKPDNSSENPFTIYYPSCVRVQRCGGCCNSDLLSCQPVDIRLRNFEIIATEFKDGKFSNVRRRKVLQVEEHMKCDCDCKVKAEHCNTLQVYDARACRCRCVNNEDKQKCDEENKIKLWDFETCLCKCRDVSECSTGFYFDEKSCSCKSDTLIYSRYETTPQKPGSDYKLSPWEQVTGLRRSMPSL